MNVINILKIINSYTDLWIKKGITEMERYEEIEKSIITTYRKKIWCQFIKGVKEFEMV